MKTTCACSVAAAHVIASKRTSDGHSVEVWSDGLVTGPVGTYIAGIGRRVLPQAARWPFAGEVFTFALAEIPALFVEHRDAINNALHPFAVVGHRSLYGR